MKKVISFCLWGDKPKYTIGALKNADIAPFIYPGWEVWIYAADNVPQDIINSLSKNCRIIKGGTGNWDSMFLRFYPISDPEVDVFISRDTDSRLNYRERRAVDQWLASDKKLHIMRDHKEHTTLILGGMWGFRGTIEQDIKEIIRLFITTRGRSNHLDIDQAFLREVIYPNYRDSAFVHDEIFEMLPFPSPRENNEYVGAPYNENNELEIPFKGR